MHALAHTNIHIIFSPQFNIAKQFSQRKFNKQTRNREECLDFLNDIGNLSTKIHSSALFSFLEFPLNTILLGKIVND